ncbi:MAG: arylsulfatase A-like enzyme [Hyphomicrobiaceae bacterium]
MKKASVMTVGEQRWKGVARVVFAVVSVQAFVESLALGWLHRDLLLAPYRFFTTQAWDPAVKLYELFLVPAGFPDPLSDFVAQGAVGKLSLFPSLWAIGILWGLLLVAGLTAVVSMRSRSTSANFIVALVVMVELVVHLVLWLPSVKIPLDPTLKSLAYNYARNAVYDGFVFSVFLAVVAGGLTIAVLNSRRAAGALGVAAMIVALTGLVGREPQMVVAAPSAELSSAAAADFNVVLISIDSLRADHLGSYGYSRDTSPAIDSLAAEGVRFERASSVTSWTLPAHVSLLTGRSLMGHGVVTDDRSLTDDVPTLPAAMQEAGYTTKAIVSAPYLNSRYGFARGFDDYDDRTIYFETNEDSYKSVTGPRLIDEAVSYLGKRDSTKPFFLFLHFWDVHYDYAPTPPYDRMFDPEYAGSVTGENFYFDPAIRRGMDPDDLAHILALYDGEIRLVDDQIARLRAALQTQGISDRTVIVVTADHGDEFFEHGEKGHHRTLYEEVLWVPLVVNVPGLNPVLPVVEQQVSIVDIAPTILSLVGAEIPNGVEGRDLSRLWNDTKAQARPAYGELYRKGSLNVQTSALVDGRKVIHHFNRRILESYDLRSDAGEQVSTPARAEGAKPVVGFLSRWLNHEWDIFDARVQAGGVDPVIIDSDTAEMLRSLGYTD